MENTKINKSAARVMDILVLLSEKDEPLTISQIGRELEMPKSSTFELLNTMVERGFLETNPQLKTYKLGLRLFEVGAAYLFNTDLHKEARPYLESLMARTGETAFLAIESSGEIVYLDKTEAPSSVRTTATLGTRSPMHTTGLGKAMLAAYPDAKVRELIGGKEFVQRTPKSIANMEDLLAELEATRKRGYSIDDEENEFDIFCLAVPVFDASDRPVAAMSVAGLLRRMTDSRIEMCANYLTEAALDVSRRLGYRHNRLFP
ncbi:IclR family transcriptional regulator [Paenibacillus sp. FJAT-26967]|uniref:IclR family transcriptional regulator n=1 Tax=Paenibacillus sp. FJAT-26967 TaxID=1729690 RepID=UPI00083934D4|nr:IclR family transcriptional regulator [Paenibacillus sp. FJAT-26967]